MVVGPDLVVEMSGPLTEAKARAARNGLTIEVVEREIGLAWPGKSWVSVYLVDGIRQVAGAAMTFTTADEGSKRRALSICGERVYNIPTG